MPDLVPASVRASDFKRAGFDTSAMLISPLPAMERPSQGRLEGNITAGAERKVVHVPADIGGLEAELFENRSSLKLLTSQVAMHLSLDERRGLFAAIDRLGRVLVLCPGGGGHEKAGGGGLEEMATLHGCLLY